MKNTLKLILGSAVAVALLSACPAEVPPDPVVPKAAVVKSFTASESLVAPGGTATLAWEVVDATSVAIRTLAGEALPLESAAALKGTLEVTVDEDTVYLLTAQGEGGADSAATSVAVEREAEGLLFAASPTELEAGQAATLVWNAAGATQVTITDGEGASVYAGADASGSVEVKPARATTYTITAGERTATAQVAVSPVIFELASAPAAGFPGEPVTLSWKAGGADSVTLSRDGQGELVTVTDAAEVADGSYEDTLPTALPTGGMVRYHLAAKTGDHVVTRLLTVYAGVEPLISELTVPEFAKGGGYFTVTWKTQNADALRLSVDGKDVYVAATQMLVDQGAATLVTPAGDFTVTLTATNARGGRVVQAVPVGVVGELNVNHFTASPQQGIAQGGQPVTLSWDVSNARNVRIVARNQFIVHEVSGVNAATGTVVVYPNKDTEYDLTAENGVGDQITAGTPTVTVGSPATLTYSPAREVPAGATITVSGSSVTGGGDMRVMSYALKNAPGAQFVDISETGTGINYPNNYDTTARLIDLGKVFETTLFGQKVGGQTISMANNGWFFFNASAVSGPDKPGTTTAPFLPSDALQPFAFAPFWADLYSGTTGEMYWQLDGSGASERLIVQWDQFELDSTPSAKITVQAQVYADGRVVFAYDTIGATMPANEPWSIGIVNGDETEVIYLENLPAPGDTYTFFGIATPPFTVAAQTQPLIVQVDMGGGAFIQIDTTLPVIPRNQFEISEVNLNPLVADGQWIEITNNAAQAFDLSGWVLDFGASGSHTIAGPLTLPANGRAVLAQSAGAADGVAVDYVWGNAAAMSAGSEVALQFPGTTYTTLALSGSAAPGVSLQRGPLTASTTLILKTGVTEMICGAAAASTYGTNGQVGTPGAANTPCPGYAYTGTITGAFEPLANDGGLRITPSGDSNESVDEIILANPVVYGGRQYSKLWVNTNGFVTLEAHACDSATDCHYNNASSTTSSYLLPVTTIAPFWDDLDLNAGGGIFWARRAGYTVVSWENAKKDISGTYDLNFQIKFFDTGTVEFHFGAMTGSTATYAKGSSATTWWEVGSAPGDAYFKVNINSSAAATAIVPNTGYRLQVQ